MKILKMGDIGIGILILILSLFIGFGLKVSVTLASAGVTGMMCLNLLGVLSRASKETLKKSLGTAMLIIILGGVLLLKGGLNFNLPSFRAPSFLTSVTDNIGGVEVVSDGTVDLSLPQYKELVLFCKEHDVYSVVLYAKRIGDKKYVFEDGVTTSTSDDIFIVIERFQRNPKTGEYKILGEGFKGIWKVGDPNSGHLWIYRPSELLRRLKNKI